MNTKLTEFNAYLEKHGSEGTRKLYIDDLEHWLDNDNTNGKELTQADAQAYIDSLTRLSPSTIAINAHAIMKWFKWQGKPIQLELPKVRQSDPEYLTVEEFSSALEKCIGQLEKTMLIVLFDSGVRIKELINLQLSDVNYVNKTIRVTRKGGKVDVVNVSDRALNELSNWIESRSFSSERIFGEMDYRAAWEIFRTIGFRIGKHLHPHMLRHSRAIQMLIAGAPMHIVQQHLGHANMATTANIYGKFTVGDLRKQIPDWSK
jgi:site-specific recombinase XerD